MQLQGSEILTFFHSYQFNYSYHGSKVLVLGKGQQEICKTEFNFDAAHMQNKKINKKHTLSNKESLSELDAQPFCANSLPSTAGTGRWGEERRGRCRGKRAVAFGAPRKTSGFEQRSRKAPSWGSLEHTQALARATHWGSTREEKCSRCSPRHPSQLQLTAPARCALHGEIAALPKLFSFFCMS